MDPSDTLEDHVILVDEQDRELGTEAKMPAHRSAKLHRAFSIFIFNRAGETMLQRRSPAKYHSGDLWTNTCCSHPRPGESVESAAHRRLKEEMGFDCPLRREFSFIYRADLDQGLCEHEFDHVLTGQYEGAVILNPGEASEWRWASVESIDAEIAAHPQTFTVWFRIAWKELRSRRK